MEESGGGLREDLILQLVEMGISRDDAIAGLFSTGNNNIELAATWIFESDSLVETPDMSDGSTKMVLVVNASLGMSPGKMAAQVAHAAVGVYCVAVDGSPAFQGLVTGWENAGSRKIVLRGEDATHLTDLATTALSVGLPHYVTVDAGLTQIPAGSRTVVGIIGTDASLDSVTGSLSLLP